MQLRSVVLCILTLSLSVFLTAGCLASAQEEVIPPSGMSGAHKFVTCEMCHDEDPWHEAKKNILICEACHPEQWHNVEGVGMHTQLLKEGIYTVGEVNLKINYCDTCHSPHNNDYLRIMSVDGEETYYTFENFMGLCLNCHFSGAAGYMTETTTRTTTRTTTTTTTTSTTTTATTTMLFMTPSELSIDTGSTLLVEGRIDPSVSGAAVTILGKPTGTGQWEVFGTAKTDINGEYSFEWTPTSEGNFDMKVSYGTADSSIYTVSVSGEEDTGFLGLLLSPIFLVAAAVAVVTVIVAVYVAFGRKKIANIYPTNKI